jgi:hypothetical protein
VQRLDVREGLGWDDAARLLGEPEEIGKPVLGVAEGEGRDLPRHARRVARGAVERVVAEALRGSPDRLLGEVGSVGDEELPVAAPS